MEGKIITCCGDCVHYDWKKHRCRNGYTNDDNPKKHFYQDCKTFEDLEEHDKQVRADAIEEYKNKIKENCHVFGNCDFEDLDFIANELKEKKKNG